MDQNASYLETFLNAPGLIHLAENIFANVDNKSLQNCRLLSKSLKDLIEKKIELDRILHWQITIGKSTIAKDFPKWIKVFKYMKNQTQNEISFFLNQMKSYLKCFKGKGILSIRNPLMFAIDDNQSSTAYQLLQLLMNADYEFCKFEGMTLLRSACTRRNCEELKILYQNSEKLCIDFNIQNSKYNILYVACIEKNADLIRMILNGANHKSIDVNAQIDYKSTPFLEVCELNFVEGVELFLEHAQDLKIDLNAKVISRKTFKETTPLQAAIRNGHFDIVKLLLNASKEKNINIGLNIFSIACEEGNLKMAKMILEHDEDYIFRQILEGLDRDLDGNVAFHYACKSGNLELVQYLEALGINLNVQNDRGRTPFHNACTYGHLDIVKHLVPLIDFNIPDKNGTTPFHFACQSGNLQLVKYFVEELSVDLSAKNKFEQTPFFWLDNRKEILSWKEFIEILEIVEYFIEKCESKNIDLISPSSKGNSFVWLFKDRVANYDLPKDILDRATNAIDDLLREEYEGPSKKRKNFHE